MDSDFQLKLAGWYFKNKRYATGYITLAEAIITYMCEINEGMDFKNQKHREQMRNSLHDSENKKRSLAKLYFQINPIRNAIAHASFDQERPSDSSAIAKAPEYLKQAQKIFKTKTLGNLER